MEAFAEDVRLMITKLQEFANKKREENITRSILKIIVLSLGDRNSFERFVGYSIRNLLNRVPFYNRTRN